MDNFDNLVKDYGINPKGKSAPMAASKKAPKPYKNHDSGYQDPNFFTIPSSKSNSGSGSLLDDGNDVFFGFKSSSNGQSQNYVSGDVFDSVFQIPSKNSGAEAVFTGSGVNSGFNDGIWGFPGGSSGNSVEVGNGNGNGNGNGDLLSSDPVDEFWGKLGLEQKGVERLKENTVDSDCLIPGFDRPQPSTKEKNASVSSLDGLEDFVSHNINKDVNGHGGGSFTAKSEPMKTVKHQQPEPNFFDVDVGVGGGYVHKEKNASVSSLDGLEDFATYKINKDVNGHGGRFTAKIEPTKTVNHQQPNFFDVDVSVGGGYVHKEKNASVSSLDGLEDFATYKINKDVNGHGGRFTAKSEPMMTVNHQQPNFFDVDVSVGGGYVHKEVDLMSEAEAPDLDMFFGAHTTKKTPISEEPPMNTKINEEPNLFSGTGSSVDMKVSARDSPDDLSFMFGGLETSEAFEEFEGESEERRALRFARYQRVKKRGENAVAEKNERDFKAQQEQEERDRIADAMEMEMKRWAKGKDGNLVALLSSLQQVLGPEFGWRAVSISDLITPSQVRLAYKKAALCIHPDKVQQRGATLHQKYVAEKTFDLLKEAWNKFNTQELNSTQGHSSSLFR